MIKGIKFNQDFSYFIAWTNKNIHVYDVESGVPKFRYKLFCDSKDKITNTDYCEELEVIQKQFQDFGYITDANILFRTNIFIVSLGKTLVVYNNVFKNQTDSGSRIVAYKNFDDFIINTHVIRTYVAVIFMDHVVILTLKGLETVTTFPTFTNNKGLGAMLTNGVFITLGSNQGHVHIKDIISNKGVSFKVHEGNIVNLAANEDSELFVVTDGLILKVYSLYSNKLLYQFKRGTFYTDIPSIFINNTFIGCISGNGTVHVFMLDQGSIPLDDLINQNQTTNENQTTNHQNKSYSQMALDIYPYVSSMVTGYIPNPYLSVNMLATSMFKYKSVSKEIPHIIGYSNGKIIVISYNMLCYIFDKQCKLVDKMEMITSIKS